MKDQRFPAPLRTAACSKALSPVVRQAWAHTLCSAGNMPLSRAHRIVDSVWAEMSNRFAEVDLVPALAQMQASELGPSVQH